MWGIPLSDASGLVGVLRVSVPITPIHKTLGRTTSRIALGGLLIALFAALLSPLDLQTALRAPGSHAGRCGAVRLRGARLSAACPPSPWRWPPWPRPLNHMATELEERLRAIRRQRNQLEAVLSSMVEGVVALDTEERVIRMNQAAARMLGMPARRGQVPDHPGGEPKQHELLEFAAHTPQGDPAWWSRT